MEIIIISHSKLSLIDLQTPTKMSLSLKTSQYSLLVMTSSSANSCFFGVDMRRKAQRAGSVRANTTKNGHCRPQNWNSTPPRAKPPENQGIGHVDANYLCPVYANKRNTLKNC